MNRQEKIFSSFNETFSKYADKRIVLYGIGQYTDWIINQCNTLPIVGVMDRWLSSGEVYGKRILSYPELLGMQVNLIIISASIYNTGIIRNRISDFCDDNCILLFDLEGNRLNSAQPDLSFKKHGIPNRFCKCAGRVNTECDRSYWRTIEDRFDIRSMETDPIGRIIIRSAYDIGYLFLGAIVSDFLFWMIDKAGKYKADEILFTARDGWLFQKLYHKLRHKHTDLPFSRYILTSRCVCMAGGITSFDDIVRYAKVNFAGDYKALLRQRFFLKDAEISNISEGMTGQDILKNHEQKILDRSFLIRKWYSRYIETEELMYSKRRVIFDLAASGTCQQVLEKLSGQNMYGLYMFRMYTEDENKKALNIEAYHPFDENFATHSMFMESILTSQQPTLQYINENGEPVYAKETRSEEELLFVREAQQGIEDYFDQILKYRDEIDTGYEYSRIPVMLYNHVISHYSVIENKIFNNYVLKDEIFGEKNDLLHKIMV